MNRNKLYYLIKPLIPRRLQIVMRSRLVLWQKIISKDVWPIDEKASVQPAGWLGWPKKKKFALVLTHDVDTARGQERCGQLMQLEEELGFRSSFNFVPERYRVSPELRRTLIKRKFEVGVHGLYHDGKYFDSREVFRRRAIIINRYIKEWDAAGYRSPCMQHNLEWFHDLEIMYDASTFDTDPFEPQSDGVGTMFPFWVESRTPGKGYVELPYTLPQDFTLYILMREKTIGIWKRKLDWIASNGGMALVNVHPDYMQFDGLKPGMEEYPAEYYQEFLTYILKKYHGEYWHVLPKDIAKYWMYANAIRERGDDKRKHYQASIVGNL